MIDKIEQFRQELKLGQTSPQERLRALQFLLHFVGDVNCVGILHGNAHTPIRLHGYWDTNLVVAALTRDPEEAASSLMSLLTPASREKWAGGDASAWASEAYEIAHAKVYAGVIDHAPAETGFVFRGFDGRPDEKCGPSKVYEITTVYDTTAKGVVKEQLAKAGLRLAGVLKESFR